VLGLPGQARADHVRARRRPGIAGARGVRSRLGQAADRYAFCHPARRGGNGMKASDIRPKTADELKQQVEDLAKEAFNLRFQRASGQLENTTRVRQVRRDIARIKTIQGERARTESAAQKEERANAEKR